MLNGMIGLSIDWGGLGVLSNGNRGSSRQQNQQDRRRKPRACCSKAQLLQDPRHSHLDGISPEKGASIFDWRHSRVVIPSAARDLQLASNCRSLAALGMTTQISDDSAWDGSPDIG